MAFSGTTAQTVFNTRKVIDRAFGRCKIPPQRISAEYIEIANDALYLMLSSWANAGASLWTVSKSIYPMYDGVDTILTEEGTIDLREVNIRTISAVTGTNTDAADRRSVEFTEDTIVSTVGIEWSGASAPLEFARSDDGATWTVIQTESPSAVSGDWTWYDMDNLVAALYFRVRATSGSLSFTTITLGNTPSEIPLYRMNRGQYASLPNKTSKSSRPTQFYLERLSRQPAIKLWPVPDATAEGYQIVAWRNRHIMDVGSMQQELELPQRWYDAAVAGLAARLALDIAEVSPDLLPVLDSKAMEALSMAFNEERDRASISIRPNIGMYTR